MARAFCDRQLAVGDHRKANGAPDVHGIRLRGHRIRMVMQIKPHSGWSQSREAAGTAKTVTVPGRLNRFDDDGNARMCRRSIMDRLTSPLDFRRVFEKSSSGGEKSTLPLLRRRSSPVHYLQ